MKPSSAAVLRLLERGPVTPLQALEEAHCLRLAARVSDLKAAGYRIDTELVTVGDKRFARYTLRVEPVQVTLW